MGKLWVRSFCAPLPPPSRQGKLFCAPPLFKECKLPPPPPPTSNDMAKTSSYRVKTGDRTEPPRTCTPGHLPQGHVPPGHLPPGHLPPGHLPPRTHTPRSLTPWTLTPWTLILIPLGHIPPRTYTPQTLKCPFWFMHHVLITYCSLKSKF